MPTINNKRRFLQTAGLLLLLAFSAVSETHVTTTRHRNADGTITTTTSSSSSSSSNSRGKPTTTSTSTSSNNNLRGSATSCVGSMCMTMPKLAPMGDEYQEAGGDKGLAAAALGTVNPNSASAAGGKLSQNSNKGVSCVGSMCMAMEGMPSMFLGEDRQVAAVTSMNDMGEEKDKRSSSGKAKAETNCIGDMCMTMPSMAGGSGTSVQQSSSSSSSLSGDGGSSSSTTVMCDNGNCVTCSNGKCKPVDTTSSSNDDDDDDLPFEDSDTIVEETTCDGANCVTVTTYSNGTSTTTSTTAKPPVRPKTKIDEVKPTAVVATPKNASVDNETVSVESTP